ncbi:hypothetical protein Tco_1023942 [Tanacetum coccineum]
MSGSQDEIPPPPPPLPSFFTTPTTNKLLIQLQTIKLPILKKGEYDIWAMKMEHYLAHTDYPIWEVIQNGNGLYHPTDSQDKSRFCSKELQKKLCGMPFKSDLDRYDESKKMQKYILIATVLEGFSVSTHEGFIKAYDRFQVSESIRDHGAEGVDWTSHSEEEEDYALMACNSSGSDTEVTSCSNKCKESYAKLKKLYDAQREQLSDASIEIKAYTQGMSANENSDWVLWGSQYDAFLSYENEVLQSVFKGKESDFENPPLYDRFVTSGKMNDVPPPMTGNYMPSGPDIEIDYSQFTSWFLKLTQPSESAELNNRMRKKSSQMEIRPIWNNVQRVNHKNQYVPTAVLTRTGKIPVNTVRTNGTNTVNTARYNFNRQAVPTNAAIKVNTVKPIVNNARPKGDFRKSVAPFRKSLNKSTTLRTIFSYQKVNTAKVNAVSAVGGKGKLLLSPQHVVIGDQKDITGTKSPNTMVDQDLEIPHRTLQNKRIVDSACSRHMTGNKAYLAEYQDFNGGLVAFGGSKGYITGKGKIKIGKLDFEDVCFVKELQHFNLFSVSQMCDKKNKVLFTNTECLVLSPEFKLPDLYVPTRLQLKIILV